MCIDTASMYRYRWCHCPPSGCGHKRGRHQTKEASVRRACWSAKGLHSTVKPSCTEDTSAFLATSHNQCCARIIDTQFCANMSCKVNFDMQLCPSDCGWQLLSSPSTSNHQGESIPCLTVWDAPPTSFLEVKDFIRFGQSPFASFCSLSPNFVGFPSQA